MTRLKTTLKHLIGIMATMEAKMVLNREKEQMDIQPVFKVVKSYYRDV